MILNKPQQKQFDNNNIKYENVYSSYVDPNMINKNKRIQIGELSDRKVSSTFTSLIFDNNTR